MIYVLIALVAVAFIGLPLPAVGSSSPIEIGEKASDPLAALAQSQGLLLEPH